MKQIKILSSRWLSGLTLLFIATISCQNSEKSNLTLLSDQIPMDTPLVFGPGIISIDDAMEFAITFNPEMDEMFFTRRKAKVGEKNKIYTMKLIEGKWTAPEAPFFLTNNSEHWDFEPHINPKGDRLYFGSRRPLNDTIESSGTHIWYLKKSENGWSEPIPLEKPFVDRFVMYITSSENNSLYFTSNEKGAKPEDGGIYYARGVEGQDVSINRMGEEINSGEWIAHSYIAPDESYMIFDGERPSGFGDCDLYISFKENGVWTESYNLGSKINTEMCEMTASVSPDGKYLFFYRKGDGKVGEDGKTYSTGNIYWVNFIQLKKELKENINSN